MAVGTRYESGLPQIKPIDCRGPNRELSQINEVPVATFPTGEKVMLVCGFYDPLSNNCKAALDTEGCIYRKEEEGKSDLVSCMVDEGELKLDTARGLMQSPLIKNGQLAVLSQTETAIMEALIKNQGNKLSSQALCDACSDINPAREFNPAKVASGVERLRKRLEGGISANYGQGKYIIVAEPKVGFYIPLPKKREPA